MSTVISAIGEATGMKPDDQAIALGALAMAKMKALYYTMCLVETTTPELRHLFHTHLQDALTEHERFTSLVVKRGWYKAHATPEELVRQAVQVAQPVLQ